MTWRGLPLIGLFLLIASAMMLAPAIIAAFEGEAQVSRNFGVSAVVCAAVSALIIVAQFGRKSRVKARSEILTVIGGLVFAPALAAMPFWLSTPFLTAEAAYFEMVSMFTTTGASVIDSPGALPMAVNFWRLLVAWLGGLFALLFAFAVLAPRNLGGYEVRSSSDNFTSIGQLRGSPRWATGLKAEAAGDRFAVAFRSVAPVYAGLTALLAVCLLLSGLSPFNAITAAFSLISTTGAAVDDGLTLSDGGALAEVLAAAFMIVAASRHLYVARRPMPVRLRELASDPEGRVLISVALAVTVWLFLRHWLGVLELDGGLDVEIGEPVGALWGAFFTALSFATTTGVISESWDAARAWSGMSNPALVMLGLAIMGGGIASTAGGVKLLRAYALLRHGEREMERLVRPSSIAGSGAAKRGLRREGAQIAWVFVMLFLLTLAAAMLALSMTGLSFELSLVAAISALSNTGPLFGFATGGASYLTEIDAWGRGVLAVVMLLGRVEVLVIVAMLNPSNWR